MTQGIIQAGNGDVAMSMNDEVRTTICADPPLVQDAYERSSCDKSPLQSRSTGTAVIHDPNRVGRALPPFRTDLIRRMVRH